MWSTTNQKVSDLCSYSFFGLGFEKLIVVRNRKEKKKWAHAPWNIDLKMLTWWAGALSIHATWINILIEIICRARRGGYRSPVLVTWFCIILCTSLCKSEFPIPAKVLHCLLSPFPSDSASSGNQLYCWSQPNTKRGGLTPDIGLPGRWVTIL